jgi:hypothetical protein
MRSTAVMLFMQDGFPLGFGGVDSKIAGQNTVGAIASALGGHLPHQDAQAQVGRESDGHACFEADPWLRLPRFHLRRMLNCDA